MLIQIDGQHLINPEQISLVKITPEGLEICFNNGGLITSEITILEFQKALNNGLGYGKRRD